MLQILLIPSPIPVDFPSPASSIWLLLHLTWKPCGLFSLPPCFVPIPHFHRNLAIFVILYWSSNCWSVILGDLTDLEIYWNYFFLLVILEIYKVSWKFSGWLCEFAHLSLILVTILVFQSVSVQTRMWASAERDGCPAVYRWRPLFNTAKFGCCPLLEYCAVTLPRRETRWNS